MARYRRPAGSAFSADLHDIQVWNAHKAGRRKGVTQATLAIGGGALAYRGAKAARKRYRKRRPRRDNKGRFR